MQRRDRRDLASLQSKLDGDRGGVSTEYLSRPGRQDVKLRRGGGPADRDVEDEGNGGCGPQASESHQSKGDRRRATERLASTLIEPVTAGARSHADEEQAHRHEGGRARNTHVGQKARADELHSLGASLALRPRLLRQTSRAS